MADDKADGLKKSTGKKATNAQKRIESLTESVKEHAEVLSALKDVPNQMAQLFQMISSSTDQGIIEPDSMPIDNQDPISSLIDKVQTPDSNEGQPDDNLINILNISQPENEYGKNLQNDVASSVSRLFQQKQPKETIDKIRSNSKTPENCKVLATPRINEEIWNILPQKARQADFYQYQMIQQQVGTASVVLAKIAEKLFDSNGSDWKGLREDLLRSNLEALTVLGNLTQDINTRRKQEIKPNLNKDIASICSTSTTSEYLFGDNLPEQLKTAKATSNVVRSSIMRSSFRGSRPTPYNNSSSMSLNWRGPPPPRRGGMNFRYRGRPSPRRQFGANRQY